MVDGEHTQEGQDKRDNFDGGEVLGKDKFANQVAANHQGGVKEEGGSTDIEVFETKEIGGLVEATSKGDEGEPFEIWALDGFEEFELEIEKQDEAEEEDTAGPGLREFTKTVGHKPRPDAISAKREGANEDKGNAFGFRGHRFMVLHGEIYKKVLI